MSIKKTYVDGGTSPRIPSLSLSVLGKPSPLLNRGSLSKFFPVFLTISAFKYWPPDILAVMHLFCSTQVTRALEKYKKNQHC